MQTCSVLPVRSHVQLYIMSQCSYVYMYMYQNRAQVTVMHDGFTAVCVTQRNKLLYKFKDITTNSFNPTAGAVAQSMPQNVTNSESQVTINTMYTQLEMVC